MSTTTINSVLVEKSLTVGTNSDGYARKKILLPNVTMRAPAVDQVSSVTMTNEGSGYSTPPAVAFTGGAGSAAAGSAVLGYAITGANIINPGVYATAPSSITADAGTGTGATFTFTMQAVEGGSIVSGGSGYQVGDLIAFEGHGTYTTAAQCYITAIGPNGAALSFNFTGPEAQHGNYSVIPTNPLTQSGSSGPGSGATFFMTWGLLAITASAGGSNYDSTTTLRVNGGTGSGGGLASPILAATGGVKAVTITNMGHNYTSAPTVAFTGGGGTSAAGTAVLTAVNDPITTSFKMDFSNTNYTVVATPNQPGVISFANKTLSGFDIILSPTSGDTLSDGAMDVTIEYTG